MSSLSRAACVLMWLVCVQRTYSHNMMKKDFCAISCVTLVCGEFIWCRQLLFTGHYDYMTVHTYMNMYKQVYVSSNSDC